MKRLMFVLVLGSVLLPLLLTTAQADPPGFNLADVNGRYAFRFQGARSDGVPMTLVGAFTADGNGNIPDVRVFRKIGAAGAFELVQHSASPSFYTVDSLGFGQMEWSLCDPALCIIEAFPTFRFVVRDRGRTLEVTGTDEQVVGGTATPQ